jgi:protein-disulfide isomerase
MTPSLRSFPAFFVVCFFALAAGAQVPAKPAAGPECACESGPLPVVWASVAEVKFGAGDLNSETAARITQLQKQVMDARAAELDVAINSRLLALEAKKRGISTYRLLETEVRQKVKRPTDEEAKAFYDQNRDRLQGDLASLKDAIIGYLRDQREQVEAVSFAERLRGAYAVKKLVETATPGDRTRVFAQVGGEPVRSGDIEDSLRPMIYSVQTQVYELRRGAVDLFINDTLLKQEATRRNLTPAALLEAEVYRKVPIVTDEMAKKFYDANKERINGSYEMVKMQVIAYLQDQEKEKLLGAYAEKLRAGADVKVFLTPPAAPVYDIPIGDQPVKGDANAKVTIVEFSDLQCPSCAAAQPVLYRLLEEYKDKVKLVVIDYPLSQHLYAFKAAEAAEAAREQGKYWEYADLLYKNQSALKETDLKAYATSVGLDRAKFDAALDSGRFADKVAADIESGNRVGVNGTPSFFVNGRPVEGTYDALKKAIDEALKPRP